MPTPPQHSAHRARNPLYLAGFAPALGLMLLCTACEKGGTKTQSPAQTGDTGSVASTAAQSKLAHFTTTDGMVGFTLDRSGSPIKLQVDGDSDIVELTQEEARNDRGELLGYRLVDPTNVARIEIGKRGDVTFVREGDELPATADRDAQPLGAPTISGPPVVKAAETPAYMKLAAALEPISVRKKFPEFAAKDSANLAKVRAALAKADASMYVHYVKPENGGWVARVETVPSDFSGMGYGGGDFSTDNEEAERFGSLRKHGALIYGVSSPESDQGNHILVRRDDSDQDVLADKTPGVVWEVDGSKVVFVSLDGGRYSIDLNQGSADAAPVATGTGPAASWPDPLQDTYADITVVSGLVKAGAHPQSTVDELEAADAQWNACVAKAWKPKRTANNVNFRAEALKVHKGCRKSMVKVEAKLVEFINARSKERSAIYAEASARAKSVGAK